MNLRKYIGLPYSPKGRDTTGLDCWGLVRLFYKQELGIDVPSYVQDYSDPSDRQSVSSAILDNLKFWKKRDKPEYGDLLVFNILGLPLHTAVYIGNGDFLHAFKNTNSCIERLSSITWRRRLVGVYRWQTT